MKAEVKAEWLTDLRSGNFKQGRMVLKSQVRVFGIPTDDDQYCCWGVLCEQAVRKGVIPEPELLSDGTYRYGNHEDRQSHEGVYYLPQEVIEWAELPDDGGPMSIHGDFARMNDQQNSFVVIADAIDERISEGDERRTDDDDDH